MTRSFVGGFPDATVTPIVTLAAGDYVVQVSTFTATNSGDMGPMKKTGKSVKLTAAEVLHLQGGKVKHLWRFFDAAAMAKQLGMMDAPPAGDPAKPAPAKGT